MSFFRRSDIGVVQRARIALEAIEGDGIYGTVTAVAKRYGISRPFVYHLKNAVLERLGGESEREPAEKELPLHKLILAMRLCCKSSIGGISEALKLLGAPCSSVGYVSEFLNRVSRNLQAEPPVPGKPISVMADEIFLSGSPVLVVMEAIGHVILSAAIAPDRSGEAWRARFDELAEKGYRIDRVAKDLASGMALGMDGMDAVSQADLFHLLKRFDPYLGALERAAFGAIEREENAFRVLENRKTEKTILKQADKCEKATEAAAAAVVRFDNYEFLHAALHEAFDPFDREGEFRDEDVVSGDVEAALDLLEEEFADHEGIMKAAAFTRKHLDGYLPYVREVAGRLDAARRSIPDYLIREICLHYGKSLKAMAVKHYGKSKKLRLEAETHLNTALAAAVDDESRGSVRGLAKALGECVRSSSALEAKNSVIRSFFDASSSQVTQSHLNLITAYLNGKVAVRGKYKGKSPLQRLGAREDMSSFWEDVAC